MEATMKKYKLTNETREHLGRTLHRIEALKDFGDVKSGDKGGFVQSEQNLSHQGNAWIYGDAEVYDNACVYDDARIYDKARVRDNAKVFDQAVVDGKVDIYENAKVCAQSSIYGEVEVSGDAVVCGKAEVYDSAWVYDNAIVGGNAEICCGVRIFGRAEIVGNALIESDRDFIVFKNWWSNGLYFTWTRSNNMWMTGCFYGTGEQLTKEAYAQGEETGKEYERVVRYVESILADKS